jgi:cytochrome c peroxidase
MKFLNILSIALFATALMTLTSCTREDNDISPNDLDLDRSLEQTIIACLNGEELSWMKMPSSNDLGNIPQDAANPLTSEKVVLGRLLFHETGLSAHATNASSIGTFSCASCHHAAGGFQAGVQQGIGDGGSGFGFAGEGRRQSTVYASSDVDRQPNRTPSAMNGAFTGLALYNGQFGAGGENTGTEALWTADTPLENNLLGYAGLETQAIAGLTVHRMAPDAAFFEAHPKYIDLFDAAFPSVAEAIRYNVEHAGLAIAAYERTLMATKSPFQKWLGGQKSAMSDEEKRGAKVFFGAGECGTCHSGPALSDGSFHAIGMLDMDQGSGSGTGGGAYTESTNFEEVAKGRGGFTGAPEDMYAFKTPQLYNLKSSEFMGHGGNYSSIREVVEYKVNASKDNPRVSGSNLDELFVPLAITDSDVDDLVVFLSTGLYDGDLSRYEPSAVLSGGCFPNADAQSSADMGCSQ